MVTMGTAPITFFIIIIITIIIIIIIIIIIPFRWLKLGEEGSLLNSVNKFVSKSFYFIFHSRLTYTNIRVTQGRHNIYDMYTQIAIGTLNSFSTQIATESNGTAIGMHLQKRLIHQRPGLAQMLRCARHESQMARATREHNRIIVIVNR